MIVRKDDNITLLTEISEHVKSKLRDGTPVILIDDQLNSNLNIYQRLFGERKLFIFNDLNDEKLFKLHMDQL